MRKRFTTTGAGVSKGGFKGGGFKSTVQKFTDLADVPTGYTGEGGKVVVVKGAEDGLEFSTEAAIDRHDVKTESDDTDPQFLNDKLTVSAPLQKTVVDDAGAKTLLLSFLEKYSGYINWLPPVDKFFDPTSGLPDPETDGTRFYSTATANGWTQDQIYQWNTDTEVFDECTINGNGEVFYCKEDKYIYFFNGTIVRSIHCLYNPPPVNRILSEPPSPYYDGDRFLIIDAAGVWAGHEGEIAEAKNTNWYFTAPVLGMTVYDKWSNAFYAYSSGEANYWQKAGKHPFAGDATDLTSNLHDPSPIADIQEMVSDGSLITSAAGEIAALTEKASPVGNDVLLMEDSADSNAKKKVKNSALGFPSHTFLADQLLSPNNADWTVNALATLSADSLNNALAVRQFDDTAEEGAGFAVVIPPNATNIILSFVSRAQTAPGGAVTVLPRLYTREVIDNTVVPAWSAATALTAIDIPTNTRFQYDTQTIALSTLSLTAGRLVLFELSRNPADGLTGDWNLLSLKISFS